MSRGFCRSFSTHSNLFSSNGDVFTSGCSYVQKRLASHLHRSVCNSDDRGKALSWWSARLLTLNSWLRARLIWSSSRIFTHMVVEGQGYMYTTPFLSMIQQLEESILRRSISVHFNQEIPSSTR